MKPELRDKILAEARRRLLDEHREALVLNIRFGYPPPPLPTDEDVARYVRMKMAARAIVR